MAEQILKQFPWFDILDSWWNGQPKYSNELTSNSAVGGPALLAEYEKLMGSEDAVPCPLSDDNLIPMNEGLQPTDDEVRLFSF